MTTADMIEPTVRTLQELIGGTYWHTNYAAFCRKLGREPDVWTETKWCKFSDLVRTLNHFDPATLAKIIAPEPAEWAAEDILRNEG